MKIPCRCKTKGAQCMIHNPPFSIAKCDHLFIKTSKYTEECKWCKIGKAWLEKNK
jgi:hypothetical protein